jgi:hypothetical protein
MNSAHARRRARHPSSDLLSRTPAGARSWAEGLQRPVRTSAHPPAATRYRVCRTADPVTLISPDGPSPTPSSSRPSTPGCIPPIRGGVNYVTFRPDDQVTSSASSRPSRSPALLTVKAFGQFQATIADRVDQGPAQDNSRRGRLLPLLRQPEPVTLGGSTSAEVGVRLSLIGRCTSSDKVRRSVHHFGVSSPCLAQTYYEYQYSVLYSNKCR